MPMSNLACSAAHSLSSPSRQSCVRAGKQQENQKKGDFSRVISLSKWVDKLLIECSSSGILPVPLHSHRLTGTGKHCVGDLQLGRFRARRFWVVPSLCRPPWSFRGWWFLLNCLMSLQGCYK